MMTKLFSFVQGRVARAGRSGTAYSLVGSDEVIIFSDFRFTTISSFYLLIFDDSTLGARHFTCAVSGFGFAKILYPSSLSSTRST